MEKIENGIIQNSEFGLIDEIMGVISKETGTEVINIRCVIGGRIAKTFFNAVREVSSEFTLIFSEEGISYCNLDDGKLSGSDGRIILTNALLHKDDFIEYSVNGVYEFGINTNALFFVGGSTIIGDVTITSDNKNKLKFSLDESNYTVKSIEIEKSEINLQNLDNTDFTIKEEFSLETITKILKSANSLKSETVRFIVKDNHIICKVETEIAEAEHKLSDISDNNEDFDLTFATSYLSVIPKYQKFFLKATRKNNPILIFLKYSTPVKFRVNIEYMSYIQCYLAPRIEESDYDEVEDSDDVKEE